MFSVVDLQVADERARAQARSWLIHVSFVSVSHGILFTQLIEQALEIYAYASDVDPKTVN